MKEANFPLEYADTFLKAILDQDLETAKANRPTGGNINRKYGPNGWTALHYAVERMALSSARWLLENGANPNERDVFGRTPLHLAIDVEADSVAQEYPTTGSSIVSAELTKLLLEKGRIRMLRHRKARHRYHGQLPEPHGSHRSAKVPWCTLTVKSYDEHPLVSEWIAISIT